MSVMRHFDDAHEAVEAIAQVCEAERFADCIGVASASPSTCTHITAVSDLSWLCRAGSEP